MQNKGITLVALVITIIVLLILATVAVVSLTGNNGIINKAQEASDKTEHESKAEQEDLNNLQEIVNQLQSGSAKPREELPQTSETTPYFPDNSFNKLPNTDLDTGLVITDGTNEYVWVEVPKSVTAAASTIIQTKQYYNTMHQFIGQGVDGKILGKVVVE